MRSFTYTSAGDATEAVRAATAESGRAFLAGGTTLLDLMKLDVMRPTGLVDLQRLHPLRTVESGSEGLRLSAFARMSEAAEHPAVLRDYPLIAQSLQLAASAQLRNMATLGGNVLQRTRCPYFREIRWAACNKRSPGSGCAALAGRNRQHAVLGTSEHCIATYPGDFAQALIALDAEVETTRRRLPFARLHRLPAHTPELEHVLEPGELIVALHVPAGTWTRRSLYLKVRDRASYQFALASAAVALDLNGAVVRHARIALGGVATVPWRSREAEAVLMDRPLDEASATAAAHAAFATARAHGENEFKLALGRRTLVRALLEASTLPA